MTIKKSISTGIDANFLLKLSDYGIEFMCVAAQNQKVLFDSIIDSGWANLVRGSDSEKVFLQSLTSIHDPHTATHAFRRFFDGATTEQINSALMKSLPDKISQTVMGEWLSAGRRSSEWRKSMIACASDLGIDFYQELTYENPYANHPAYSEDPNVPSHRTISLLSGLVMDAVFLDNLKDSKSSFTAPIKDLLDSGVMIDRQTTLLLVCKMNLDKFTQWIDFFDENSAVDFNKLLDSFSRMNASENKTTYVQSKAAKASISSSSQKNPSRAP